MCLAQPPPSVDPNFDAPLSHRAGSNLQTSRFYKMQKIAEDN